MRQEFTKAVKVARVKHTTKDGVTFCEGCALPVKPGRFHFDHDDADGLTGKPTFENCRLLCTECHAIKTKDDVAKIAKAKRREAAHLGVKTESPRKIQSRGFEKSQKTPRINKAELPELPRRPLYEDIP